MYSDEKSSLNEIINQGLLKKETSKKLQQLVDDFFCRNYQGISENEAKKVKLEFLERVKTIKISQVEVKYNCQELIDQIKGNLFFILDRSIDRKINDISQKDEIFILEPNINGIGIHLKPLVKKLKCLNNKPRKK